MAGGITSESSRRDVEEEVVVIARLLSNERVFSSGEESLYTPFERSMRAREVKKVTSLLGKKESDKESLLDIRRRRVRATKRIRIKSRRREWLHIVEVK